MPGFARADALVARDARGPSENVEQLLGRRYVYNRT
jgi:hypothetical protein